MADLATTATRRTGRSTTTPNSQKNGALLHQFRADPLINDNDETVFVLDYRALLAAEAAAKQKLSRITASGYAQANSAECTSAARRRRLMPSAPLCTGRG